MVRFDLIEGDDRPRLVTFRVRRARRLVDGAGTVVAGPPFLWSWAIRKEVGVAVEGYLRLRRAV
jgi:hypothetical protein